MHQGVATIHINVLCGQRILLVNYYEIPDIWGTCCSKNIYIFS